MTEDRMQLTLRTGERAPPCYGMDKSKSFYSFDAQAGRPAVIILSGSLPPSVTIGIATLLNESADAFSALGSDVLLMVDGEADCALAYEATAMPGVQVVYCLKDYFDRCGFASQRPWVFLIDRNQRILDQFDPCDGADWIASALACLATIPIEEPRCIGLPAPLLSIPAIFSPAFCRTLIAHFEGGSPSQGGMASIDRSGHAVHKIDVDKKRRQDCVLQQGEAIHGQVVSALTRCCLPEMKKAFQFDAHYTDRILIARYDDTGGYFKRHRDNVAASVAFRQFALSVNLNAGEYEGGHLSFPEYNGHLYRPATGGGIIFSASLLHEAMPVTRGRRYVLLTFFHNAEAEAIRAAGLIRSETMAA
jgi:predicted 2-oxoglutarate/Fe(II)-dependent dioxygenase YbiX